MKQRSFLKINCIYFPKYIYTLQMQSEGQCAGAPKHNVPETYYFVHLNICLNCIRFCSASLDILAITVALRNFSVHYNNDVLRKSSFSVQCQTCTC